MGKIVAYFNNNHAVEFEREKALFKNNTEVFSLSNLYDDEDTYANLVKDGKALINWENVAFVKEAKEHNPLEED